MNNRNGSRLFRIEFIDIRSVNHSHGARIEKTFYWISRDDRDNWNSIGDASRFKSVECTGK